MKRLIGIAAVTAISLFAGILPSSAQVNTGGSNFSRAGVPPEGQVLYNRGRSGEFGRNNPWVPGSEYAPGGGYGRRHVQQPRYYPQQRRGYGGQHYATGYRQSGAYQQRLITRFGGSTVSRAGATRVPSPEEIAARVPHKRTRTEVPCITGYAKNPANNQCDMVSWTPGPDPE